MVRKKPTKKQRKNMINLILKRLLICYKKNCLLNSHSFNRELSQIVDCIDYLLDKLEKEKELSA